MLGNRTRPRDVCPGRHEPVVFSTSVASGSGPGTRTPVRPFRALVEAARLAREDRGDHAAASSHVEKVGSSTTRTGGLQ